MRWRGRRGSDNVEDRRSMGGPALAGGGLGIGGLIIVVVLLFLGVLKPQDLMDMAGPQGQQGHRQGAAKVDPNDEDAQFVSVVLADTEDVWEQLFADEGLTYDKPTLVLFSGSVRSACGIQGSATGPFYCPSDQQVYIDLSFYDELRSRLGAPGDFAQAYVIAHEVGHHVQNLRGTSDEIYALRRRASETEANRLSVRQELQADYYAGVWAHHAQKRFNILEEGDLQEAIGATEAIGDDRLQRQAQGYEMPEKFTHGTSEQRTRWFLKGFRSGDMNGGDTYSIPYNNL